MTVDHGGVLVRNQCMLGLAGWWQRICVADNQLNCVQGEPRDSSDEEWEVAYTALDPAEQIGWGNRRGQMNEVGVPLVRDVFEAADELHEAAMSEMDGNTQLEDDIANVGADAVQDRAYFGRERSVDRIDGEDVAVEGDNSKPGVYCSELSKLCGATPWIC